MEFLNFISLTIMSNIAWLHFNGPILMGYLDKVTRLINTKSLLLEIDRKLSALVFASPIGVSERLAGYINRFFYSLLSKVPKNIIDNGRTLREDGFEYLGAIAEPRDIEDIRKYAEESMRQERQCYSTIIKSGSVIQEIVELDDSKIMATIKRVVEPKVLNAFRSMSKSNIQILYFLFMRNHPVKDLQGESYSDFWHVDGCRTDLMKCFILLSDVGENSGATRILTRQKTREVLRSNHRIRQTQVQGSSIEVLDKMHRENQVLGKSGHGYIWDPTTCLHCAGITEENENPRDILMITAVPSTDNNLDPIGIAKANTTSMFSMKKLILKESTLNRMQ